MSNNICQACGKPVEEGGSSDGKPIHFECYLSQNFKKEEAMNKTEANCEYSQEILDEIIKLERKYDIELVSVEHHIASNKRFHNKIDRLESLLRETREYVQRHAYSDRGLDLVNRIYKEIGDK